ncbi:MAG: ABC transporter ATP-binding protein, partial [Candidatus Methylomirabilales bacterium]
RPLLRPDPNRGLCLDVHPVLGFNGKPILMIEVIDLYKFFNGQEVLKGVSLSIAKGEIFAIIGQSGGGKTVLLKHLVGLLKPDRGRVVVDGVDLGGLGRRQLNRVRERFGMVFQGGALFDSLTVFDNVAFPLREKTSLPDSAIAEKVVGMLKQVGLRDVGHKYPAELSGGMRKRVALARALIMEPEILLLDEPTTGLDPIRMSSIHNLILDLHRQFGFTCVLVSHEIPEIFDVATKVAMLHQGTVVEVGTPKEIQDSSNPIVRQFIMGTLEGPIPLE